MRRRVAEPAGLGEVVVKHWLRLGRGGALHRLRRSGTAVPTLEDLGELINYAFDHELASFGVIVGICVLVFLAKLGITEWLARRRNQPPAPDQATNHSVLQKASVGNIKTGGGDVEISQKADSR